MSDISLEKTLPYDLEVERIILAVVLVEGGIDFDLEPDDLYSQSHRVIFKTAKDIQAQGRSPDMITVLSQLRTDGKIEECGGPAYLASLTDGMPHFKDGLAPQYVEIIREKAALRRLIQASMESMTRSYQAEESFREISGDLIAAIDKAHAALEPAVGPISMETAVSEAYQQVERIADLKQRDIRTGLSLGFEGLDRLIPAGIASDDYMIIASRPGQGKTSLLLGILANMAKDGRAILFFSIEMGRLMIMMRLFSIVSEVPLMKLLTGFVNKDEWAKLGRAAGTMSQWKVWIDDSTGIHAHDIGARIRRLRQPLDAILLDYVQLLQSPKHLYKATDEQKVAYNSMHLKFMARSMKTPIIACAQLNRSPNKRKEEIPRLSDLRQSGQLEQDCDIALLIHQMEGEDHAGVAQLIIAKQRNGPTGEVALAFIGQFTKFASLWQDSEGSAERWYDR
jgi:replicative DNA helicase